MVSTTFLIFENKKKKKKKKNNNNLKKKKYISTHLEDQSLVLAHQFDYDWNAAAPLEIWLVEGDEC